MISPEELQKLHQAKKDLSSFLRPPVRNPEGEYSRFNLGKGRVLDIWTNTYLAHITLAPRSIGAGYSNWEHVTEDTLTERGPRGGLRALRFRNIDQGVIIPEDLVPDTALREKIIRGFQERDIQTQIQPKSTKKS